MALCLKNQFADYTVGGALRATASFNEEKRETVAVKTVFQDPQYQNRELEIMKRLNHDSIVRLKYYYLSERRNGTYLHLPFPTKK